LEIRGEWGVNVEIFVAYSPRYFSLKIFGWFLGEGIAPFPFQQAEKVIGVFSPFRVEKEGGGK